MDYQTHITTNIKKLRLQNNLTQEQFAEKIEITTEALRNIERNRNMPRAKNIDKICQAFNIRPIDLLLNEQSDDEKGLRQVILDKLSSYNLEELSAINSTIDALNKMFVIKQK